MPRLFVALDLPESLRSELSRLGRAVEAARPTPLEQLHVTLRFLGEVDEELGGRFAAEAAGLRAPAFELTPSGLGCFPNARRPRIAWAGFEPCQPLLELQAAMETLSRDCGLEPETKPFRPHVTLARWKRPDRRAAVGWLEEQGDFAAPPFLVTRFHLYSSVLHPSGAEHRRLRSFGLRTS